MAPSPTKTTTHCIPFVNWTMEVIPASLLPIHILTSWRIVLPKVEERGGSDGKASAYNAGDLGSIPGLGRSSGEGNGNPLQYSCLENPVDGGAW